LRTPQLAEVNVTELVSTAAPHAVWRPLSRAGAAADVLDPAELVLFVAVRLVALRSRAAAGGGVLWAPRDGAPRGRSRARTRVGAPAAAARRRRRRGRGCGERLQRLAEPARRRRRARARHDAPVGADEEMVASRRTGVSGCAPA